jgi:GNAT superfamily N-acetyltransferase
MRPAAYSASCGVVTDRPFASLTFDPGVHGATRFDSGVPTLDDWLRKHASSAMRARVARTFAWIPADSDAVVAYYSLSAHAVTRDSAPARIGRGVPDPVPAALIAKLALDRSLQGQGLGRVLLADALERIITASERGPAVRAIVVDALTDKGRDLYAACGFVEVPGAASRMILRAEAAASALGR